MVCSARSRVIGSGGWVYCLCMLSLGGLSAGSVCIVLGGGGLGGRVRGVVLQGIVFFLVWAGPPRRGPPPHPVTYLLKSSYSIANLLY